MTHGIPYFSMFTGVGGFELGLEGRPDSEPSSRQSEVRQGRGPPAQRKPLLRGGHEPALPSGRFRCVGFAETDKFATKVLRKRFPHVRNYGDVTKLRLKDLPNFDLLCGGFPCQAFSVAGKRRGFQDTRGSLFFEIARVLRTKRPSFVLLENVKGLLNHEGGETYRVILQTLGQLGYKEIKRVFSETPLEVEIRDSTGMKTRPRSMER